MKSYAICKDCGKQFESSHPSGKAGELNDLAQATGRVELNLVGCMDICPKDQISLAPYIDGKVAAPKGLSVEEITALINAL